MKKHFLTLMDLSSRELTGLIERAVFLKKKKIRNKKCQGKILALVFEKESTRTRISFEVAMARLGGSTIYLGQNASQLSRGESYADTAKVLSRYLNGLVLRTFSQEHLEEMAANSDIPVINGLTDLHHPCQVMADLMTVLEFKKNLKKVCIAYVGDGNNMANSWIEASHLLGFPLNLACPKGYWPNESILNLRDKNPQINITTDPIEAVSQCDVINTDTWFSMGHIITDEKKSVFQPYQVNEELLSLASPKAIVMHCLPAHRGEEITDDVLDGPHSVVFDQAENRLYVQMAILEKLL